MTTINHSVKKINLQNQTYEVIFHIFFEDNKEQFFFLNIYFLYPLYLFPIYI
jgi:hypothetical protein